ncbi:MAG: SusC/RagA family TonB-linked outer membrane protein [Bacteroidales bacterium]|nr:SusC/RagA family TonB-linked outer membrane protein [Bacteroidales bacterium]MCF8403309.1 SusC/RagA family TonB-linked outer membrane protein [Bacteroidales bacterium]
MRKFTLFLAFIFFIGMQFLQAQDREIKGTITSSDDGQPIPGVQVLVKGTTTGTVTNLDGKYTLAVPETAKILVFRFVGMATQEVAIGSQTEIAVVMEPDVLNLEGVVVTALGISREKKSLGYAVQEVDGADLNQVRETNFVNSISGRVSGVHVRQSNTMGGSANVLIRGTTSLTQNNQALFVVDGVPIDNNNTNEDRVSANETTANQNDGWGGYDYGNAAADINPDDIESMSVLKGAAATALYGSRAANGVILITTKKGTRGKKGIGVTVNSGVQISNVDKATMPKWQDKYGGGYGPFYENENYPGAQDYYFFYDETLGIITPTSEDASWGHPFDPNLMVVQWDALDPNASNYGEKRPWVAGENGLDYFFSTGVKWTNNVSFDAGNDFGRFRLSYTNVDEKGMAPNSSLKKNSINFAGDYNFSKRLKTEANLTYSNTSVVGRQGTGYDGGNPMQSFGQWFERNVDLKRLEDRYLRADGSQLSWNSAYWNDLHPIYFDNPYWVRYKNFEDDSRDRIFGFAGLTYEFTDWLSISGKMMLDNYQEIQNERIAVGSVDPSYFSSFNRKFRETNYEMMLKFNKNFGDISLNGLVGTNSRKNMIQSILGETNGGLVVPDFYSISNSVSPAAVTESLAEWGINSVFASASFGYKSFLYLDLTARNDQSSTLPENENSYFYPSASLSVVLSELGGIQDLDWLSFAKFRAAYAAVGNDAPYYSVYNTYQQNTSWGNEALFSVNDTKQNDMLKPEKTSGLEFGLEASFFQRRLSFDIAYYKSNSTDQIMPVLVSPSTGYNRMFVNGGEIENKGIEIAALGTPVKTSSFQWDIGINWTKNQNEVLSLYGGVENLLIYSAWDVSVNATVGEPYGTIKGTDFVYTDGKKTVGEDGYYLKTESGEEIIGNIQPDWNMGIPTSFTYKGFTLNLLVDIQKGGDVYSVNTKYGQATGLYFETAENNDKGIQMRNPVEEGGGYRFPETVYEDGSENTTYVPAFRWGRAWYYNNSPTARYVFDASYVKLREVALSYTLPQSVVDKTPLQTIVFSVVGRNVWIIHKNTEHFDPEAGLGSGNQQGIETGSWPIARTFGFNLKLGI